MTVEQAYTYCSVITRSHYENFPVGLLVPKRLQHHVHAIYAFARHADDLADEGYDAGKEAPVEGAQKTTMQAMAKEERLAALEEWRLQLFAKPRPDTPPVFIALHNTIEELELPVSLFTDLISAFKQDVVKTRYQNFEEVLDYCRRSANPVGRLVLLLHGHCDDARMACSDDICTALQLANFWQDIAVDLAKDRIYLPQEELTAFCVAEDDLFKHRVTPQFLKLMRFQCERTQEFFDSGANLIDMLEGRLRWEIRFTWLGGVTILRKIQEQGYDTLNRRPKLGKVDFLSLLGQSIF